MPALAFRFAAPSSSGQIASPPFRPLQIHEPKVGGGSTTFNLQAITAMGAYQDKSFEELHLDDITKGSAASLAALSFPTASSVSGSVSFGSPPPVYNSASSIHFGAATADKTASSTAGFGQQTSSSMNNSNNVRFETAQALFGSSSPFTFALRSRSPSKPSSSRDTVLRKSTSPSFSSRFDCTIFSFSLVSFSCYAFFIMIGTYRVVHLRRRQHVRAYCHSHSYQCLLQLLLQQLLHLLCAAVTTLSSSIALIKMFTLLHTRHE